MTRRALSVAHAPTRLNRLLCALGFHAWRYHYAQARCCDRLDCPVEQVLLLSTERAGGEWVRVDERRRG